MAGLTQHEGSALAVLDTFKLMIGWFITKNDFINFVNKSDDQFHDLNVEKITDFYFKNVKTSDSYTNKWKIFDFYGDILIKCPTYLFAKRYAEQSTPETNVYFYELTHKMRDRIPLIDPGIYHTADLDQG